MPPAVTFTENVQFEPVGSVAPERLIAEVPAVAVMVPPPHEPVSPFGVATVKPTGSESLNPTPVSWFALAAGFVIVNVSEVVAPVEIVDGLNAMAIDGGASTTSDADAVPPVPPSVEVTWPVVLFCCPAATPVTLIVNVQLELVPIVPPERLTVPEPALAVIVPPPQEPVTPFGLETCRPAGRLSVNATPCRTVVELLFWIRNVSDVEPPSGTDATPKNLMITGGATTVIEAFEVLPTPPSVDVTCTELFLIPALVPCTLTVMVQPPLAASIPPDRLMLAAPAVAVAVPPQLLVRFGVPATTSPAGRLSVNAIPLSAALGFGLEIVNVSDVDPFSGIPAAPNALVIVGGETANAGPAVTRREPRLRTATIAPLLNLGPTPQRPHGANALGPLGGL